MSINSYRRWLGSDHDHRPEAHRPQPAHALSEVERAAVLEQCHGPAFASLPPAQIIQRLLDEEGPYLASESTSYRILRAAGEQQRRGRAAPPSQVGPPRRHEASAPNTVWSAIRYVTPEQRHNGRGAAILVERERLVRSGQATTAKLLVRRHTRLDAGR